MFIIRFDKHKSDSRPMSSSAKLVGDIVFNNNIIPPSQIFLVRKNVFGIVNHKPFVKGHVLICSRKVVSKIEQLTEIETLDLFMTAQEVSKKLSAIHNVQYEQTIQNGKEAGQTVPHVHIHLCPKPQGDGPSGLENAKDNKGQTVQKRGEDDMAREADKYRSLFEQSYQ